MCVNNLSKVALDSAAAGFEPAISSRKSNALTKSTPPSHICRWKCINEHKVNYNKNLYTWLHTTPIFPVWCQQQTRLDNFQRISQQLIAFHCDIFWTTHAVICCCGVFMLHRTTFDVDQLSGTLAVQGGGQICGPFVLGFGNRTAV